MDKGDSIYNEDGSINNDHHPSWDKKIQDADKNLANDDRVILGLDRNKKLRPRPRAGRPPPAQAPGSNVSSSKRQMSNMREPLLGSRHVLTPPSMKTLIWKML